MKQFTFEEYSKYLFLQLSKGGYPHEIICFLLKQNGFGLSNRDIIAILCDKRFTLYDIAAFLAVNYQPSILIDECFVSILDTELWNRVVVLCFRNLEIALNYKVGDMIKSKDSTARRRWHSILQQKVGETRFDDYFGKDPSHDISNWVANVVRNLTKWINREDFATLSFDDLVEKEMPKFEKLAIRG